VGDVDRARILETIVRCAARSGLEALTVDEVLAAAAVSRSTFAEHFCSLEAASLVALRTLTARLYDLTVAAQERGSIWTHGFRAGIVAGLDFLAEDPTRLRFLCEEAPKLGRPAWVLHEQTARRYATRLRTLREVRGGAAPLPAVCYEVMVGAMYALLRQASAQGHLPTVEDMAVCVVAVGVPVRPPLVLVA
jgi:AcrR family transcriptional regulator